MNVPINSALFDGKKVLCIGIPTDLTSHIFSPIYLAGSHCKINHAFNVLEAHALIEKEKPDLVLMDPITLQSDQTDPTRLLQRLKADNIPRVVSGNGAALRKKAEANGAEFVEFFGDDWPERMGAAAETALIRALPSQDATSQFRR